jgi:cytochrome P450
MLLETTQSSWLNSVTFDIIGDLSFGEPFGCLEAGVMHPWVEIMFSSLRDIVFLAALSHLPKPIFKVIKHILAWVMFDDLERYRKFSADRVDRRLKLSASRNDFMSLILRKEGDRAMSRAEIEASFNVLVVTGMNDNFLH